MKSESRHSDAPVMIPRSHGDTGSFNSFLESQVDAAVRAAHKGRKSTTEQTQSPGGCGCACACGFGFGFDCVHQKGRAWESSERSEEERAHQSCKTFTLEQCKENSRIILRGLHLSCSDTNRLLKRSSMQRKLPIHVRALSSRERWDLYSFV